MGNTPENAGKPLQEPHRVSGGPAALTRLPLDIPLKILQLHSDHPFFTLGMNISSGSSTSWMMRNSSRVGGLVSPFTREMSRSN